MSTRATISFRDEHDSFTIYRHSDGYPQSQHGVLHTLRQAFPYAWPLPRFEADEFAAATVAAWKTHPDNIRLTTDRDTHGDTEYHYEVSQLRGQAALYVKVFARTGTPEWTEPPEDRWTPLWAARITPDRVKPLPLSKADALARKAAGLDSSKAMSDLATQDECMPPAATEEPQEGPEPHQSTTDTPDALTAAIRALVAEEVAKQMDRDTLTDAVLADLRARLS